jgi:Flp pilus assembly protein TadD
MMNTALRPMAVALCCCLLGACQSAGSTAEGGEPSQNIKQLAADIEERGDDVTAMAVYQRAAELSPRDASIHVAIGDIHSRQRRFKEAITAYQAALRVDPANADALIGIGGAEIAGGDAEQGVIALKRAASVAKSSSAWNRLGVAQTQAGLFEEAAASYRMALKAAPQDMDIRTNLALATALAGRYDEAGGIMGPVTQSPTAQPRHRAAFALVLALGGKQAEARAALPEDMPKAEVDAILKGAEGIRGTTDPRARGQKLSIITAG